MAVWVDGTQKINLLNMDPVPWGSVALGGWDAKFSAVKIGCDNNSDYDIDDAGDDLVLDESFADGAVDADEYELTYDNNGNLTQDADYGYAYDAPALDTRSGEGSELVWWERGDEKVDGLPACSTVFEGSLPSPGLVRRLAAFEVDKLDWHSHRCGPNVATPVFCQAAGQVVRAPVVELPVRAAQDVHIAFHHATDCTNNTARQGCEQPGPGQIQRRWRGRQRRLLLLLRR